VFDEDSRYCYFNPHTFETTDQYFLVGVVLGLAIYNSTILDVAFPPFAFRKLLAAAPASTASSSVHQRPVMNYTLDDLAELRPRLASGLRQLLEFEGDVESTFCLDFAIEVDKYGARSQVPLCWGGEKMPVTNANRREYVDLYVKYVLDDQVKRQFEPFKRGFFTVCAGNALSLFRPEEIELLVRGSDEPLDIRSLRAVAKYNNWNKSKSDTEPEGEATIDWFWDSFAAASPSDQRRLLSFITGSDRIPAMGAASLVIKLTCLGDDSGRYPTARTCFNVLNLYRCQTRERLESTLWTAVNESEGFGLR
jgi:E3 ubiquitin-protein ligase HECTD2